MTKYRNFYIGILQQPSRGFFACIEDSDMQITISNDYMFTFHNYDTAEEVYNACVKFIDNNYEKMKEHFERRKNKTHQWAENK